MTLEGPGGWLESWRSMQHPADPDTIRALRGQPGVSPGAIERAFELLLAPPEPTAWRAFLDRSLAGLGSLLLLAGVFFFFAYNWRELGRTGKFVLLEGLILGTFLASWRLGPGTAGRVCLAAASALIGALLAVYGQAYQTGADSYRLFATWAGLAVPWVVAAAFAPLWLGWLVLLNVAAVLFLSQMGLLGWDPWEEPAFAFSMAALNGVVWAAGEALRSRWAWLRTPWLLPCAGVMCLFYLTWTAAYQVAAHEGYVGLSTLVLGGVLALVAAYYRSRRRDLFFLAGACASLITTLTTAVIRATASAADEPAFWLLIAVVLLAQLALAASWLRFESRRP
ncbi:MAG: DUF2157 domain-containing protein [Candidatus Eremiobacterota bacterium]